MSEMPRLTLLQQRTMEARALGPLVRAFQEEVGEKRANAVLRRAIVAIARERGRELAQQMGRNDLEAFVQAAKSWRSQGAVEIQELEQTPTSHAFNVTSCKFVQMYQELGLLDLGFLLSCTRDLTLCQGFNPRLKLTRTQTLMEGAPLCDFRYTLEP